MKKFLFGMALVLVLWWFGHSTLTRAQVDVEESWAQVESVMQRRYDLIPNLVNTVKGYAKHESEVLEKITELRSKVGQINFKDLATNPQAMAEYQELAGKMKGALHRLMVVVENYPQLKADASFLTLMSQLEGTENRITVERQRYNQAVSNLNYYVRNLLLKPIVVVHKFYEAVMFKADQAAAQAPKVEF